MDVAFTVVYYSAYYVCKSCHYMIYGSPESRIEYKIDKILENQNRLLSKVDEINQTHIIDKMIYIDKYFEQQIKPPPSKPIDIPNKIPETKARFKEPKKLL